MKRIVSVAVVLLSVAAAPGQAERAGSTSSGQAPSTGSGQGQSPPAAQSPPAQRQRPPQPPLGPTQWRIDRSHSQANFSVRHNVVSTVRGQLGSISGTIEYDGQDVRSVKADVTIDVTQINTQNQNRDAHLRRDDFFNTEQFPTLTFTSTRVEPASDGRFRLIGDLTIRDKTHEVALDVEGPSPIVKSPRGVLTGATATTKISRKAFGVLWNNMIEMMPVVGDEVTVTIDLELNRPALPGSTQ
jgi:polyisoprenoid-binding protein YceI